MDPDALLAKHRGGRVLLDTNLLLMYLVGFLRRDLVESFKRTRAFTGDDWALLDDLLAEFHEFVTTPHVLTEVSNLGGHLRLPLRRELFRLLERFAGHADEHIRPSRDLVQAKAFERLGLTNVAVADPERAPALVLTADLNLYLHCLERGADALNFNHLRHFGWR
ncbi:MAG: PIN domain-containing protein [Myxococcota bacterium]